jgi:hypothetical protein
LVANETLSSGCACAAPQTIAAASVKAGGIIAFIAKSPVARTIRKASQLGEAPKPLARECPNFLKTRLEPFAGSLDQWTYGR